MEVRENTSTKSEPKGTSLESSRDSLTSSMLFIKLFFQNSRAFFILLYFIYLFVFSFFIHIFNNSVPQSTRTSVSRGTGSDSKRQISSRSSSRGDDISGSRYFIFLIYLLSLIIINVYY